MGCARDVNVNVSHPYVVRCRGRERRFQHGRDAVAFARRHRGAEVYFTAHRYERLDYAVQVLPCSDKAKPPKGGMGAFCKGQATKFVQHHVAREASTVRVY
jgi:hypothetical protein